MQGARRLLLTVGADFHARSPRWRHTTCNDIRHTRCIDATQRRGQVRPRSVRRNVTRLLCRSQGIACCAFFAGQHCATAAVALRHERFAHARTSSSTAHACCARPPRHALHRSHEMACARQGRCEAGSGVPTPLHIQISQRTGATCVFATSSVGNFCTGSPLALAQGGLRPPALRPGGDLRPPCFADVFIRAAAKTFGGLPALSGARQAQLTFENCVGPISLFVVAMQEDNSKQTFVALVSTSRSGGTELAHDLAKTSLTPILAQVFNLKDGRSPVVRLRGAVRNASGVFSNPARTLPRPQLMQLLRDPSVCLVMLGSNATLRTKLVDILQHTQPSKPFIRVNLAVTKRTRALNLIHGFCGTRRTPISPAAMSGLLSQGRRWVKNDPSGASQRKWRESAGEFVLPDGLVRCCGIDPAR